MSDIRAADVLTRGLWRENPVIIALLGLCPALAVTNSAINGLAMGAATFFVLVGSSTLVSLLRKLIPKQIRISTYIIIIATFVTVADYSLLALLPEVHRELGAFIALIVVNCMILGRQESFASRHGPGLAVMDAVGVSVGFTGALFAIGAVREVLGSGSLFGMSLFGASFEPWVIMVLPPGGFFTLGALLLLINGWKERGARAGAHDEGRAA
jgi:electron transport complex protein RnfE